MLKIEVSEVKIVKKEGNTLAYFSATVLEGEDKIVTLPNMRLAKKQDGGLKVAPAVHRKVKGKPRDGEAQGDDIFPKCYYPYTALNKLIFPIAQKAYQDRLAVTKKV